MGGNGRKAMPEVTVMKVPVPRRTRCGVKASMTRMVPSRLVSIVVAAASKCAGSRRSSRSMTPDIVTTVSSSGYRASAASRADATEVLSVTSMLIVPKPSSASSESASGLRPPTATVLPAAANRRASSRPIPEVPPTMRTVRLERSTRSSLRSRAPTAFKLGADSDVFRLFRGGVIAVLAASAGCGRASVFPGPVRAPSEIHAPHYGGGMKDEESGNRLGSYLRARRELVSPEQAGIPPGGNRRVPGLRREEVALLAGISPDYYLRLE